MNNGDIGMMIMMITMMIMIMMITTMIMITMAMVEMLMIMMIDIRGCDLIMWRDVIIWKCFPGILKINYFDIVLNLG